MLGDGAITFELLWLVIEGGFGAALFAYWLLEQ
jgi:hypothetical protein